MTATLSARREDGAIRWLMLAIISLGFISLTLNWFDVATAFGLIGAEFKVGLPSLSYLISLFIVGYGAAHAQLPRLIERAPAPNSAVL